MTGPTPAQRLGRRVHAERAVRGWTLRQVGIGARVSFMTVDRLEKGRNIGFNHAARIAAVLGVPLDGGEA